MSLPKRLTTEELSLYGYEYFEPGTVRNERWNSYRIQCMQCKIWCKHLLNNLCEQCCDSLPKEEAASDVRWLYLDTGV